MYVGHSQIEGDHMESDADSNGLLPLSHFPYVQSAIIGTFAAGEIGYYSRSLNGTIPIFILPILSNPNWS